MMLLARHSFFLLSASIVSFAANSSVSVLTDASDTTTAAAFILVSGISASEEFCLTVENGVQSLTY